MNKTVFITGASRGIGRACALTFAKNGYNIAANYFSNDEMADSLVSEVEKFGVKCETYKFDVADENAADEAVSKAIATFGEIDVLINNAGIALQKLFHEVTSDECDRLFKVNTKGAVNMAKFVSRHMIKNHGGKIINISSMWGSIGGSMEVHYSATKAALIGLTKALSKELGPSNINVNCITPGYIDTDMNKHHSEETVKAIIESTSLMRVGTGEDVANLALFLASEQSSFITGQVIGVDGGV